MVNELLSEMAVIRDKIEKNEQLFNLTDDPDITEALIFEQKALSVRLSRVISAAKRNGISIGYEDIHGTDRKKGALR